jgi:hypothetical protein
MNRIGYVFGRGERAGQLTGEIAELALPGPPAR